jgi:hypothetical protein
VASRDADAPHPFHSLARFDNPPPRFDSPLRGERVARSGGVNSRSVTGEGSLGWPGTNPALDSREGEG